MIKRVNAMEARKQLGRIMNEVSLKMDQYIIERGGKPMVAVIPMQQFERLQDLRKEFFEAVKDIRAAGKDLPFTLIKDEVAEAVRKVRAGKGKKKG